MIEHSSEEIREYRKLMGLPETEDAPKAKGKPEVKTSVPEENK